MTAASPSALYFSQSVRRIEARHAHLPLMERAGAAAADWAMTLADPAHGPVLILAGPGNNGGDAFVVARLLRQRFFAVCVVFAGEIEHLPAKLPTDARAAYAAWCAAGGSVLAEIPNGRNWALAIDGLFGIGLSRPPEGRQADWIRHLNTLPCPILSLDCPSGLNCDTGTAFSPCVRASHTLSFIAAKPGLLTLDGPDHCGEVRIADLDLPPASEPPADGEIIQAHHFAEALRPRAKNSHKGSYGSAGILGGARSMVGAALLAGRAALKLGAGRVYLGLLDPDGPSVDLVQPELMIRRADTLLAADVSALACGPGLGQSRDAHGLLEAAIRAPLPLVLDADALNLLASDSRLAETLGNRIGSTILTPHPAEAARLLACRVSDVQADRIAAARQLAQQHRATVVLKGCGSLVATPDGRWWINTTGNPGMATAGMGDVLSGLIVALLAQGWSAEMATLAAVHLHGTAADRLLADDVGPAGMTAGEVIDSARRVFNAWLRG